MNVRESYIAVMNYKPVEHIPVLHFGYWDQLIDEWVEQGHITKEQRAEWGWRTEREVSKILGLDADGAGTEDGSHHFLKPGFAVEVIRELPDGSRHVRNGEGVIEMQVPGTISIAAEIEHLLVDRASWEEHYKPRLVWSEERVSSRLTPDYLAELNARTDKPVGMYLGSVLGSIRNWIGVVGMSYMQLDDPELLQEIVATVADVAYRNAKRVLEKGYKPDFGHYWEDICFNHGPLVSPDFFRATALPHYKRMTELLYAHGAQWISVDCDGKIDELIPIWLDSGVNTMFPMEIGTWNPDFAGWRAQYGRELRGIGGMNKHVLSYDRAAVDAEIERLKPWVALGGFIPCPDHRLPPGTQWDLVKYYTDKMRETF